MIEEILRSSAFVLLAVILYQGLGFLWYGPLFGDLWRKEVCMKRISYREEEKRICASAQSAYIGVAMNSMVMAFVLYNLIIALHFSTFIYAVLLGLGIGAGFIIPSTLTTFLFEGRGIEKKSFALYIIDNAYPLLGLMLMGAVFSFAV